MNLWYLIADILLFSYITANRMIFNLNPQGWIKDSLSFSLEGVYDKWRHLCTHKNRTFALASHRQPPQPHRTYASLKHNAPRLPAYNSNQLKCFRSTVVDGTPFLSQGLRFFRSVLEYMRYFHPADWMDWLIVNIKVCLVGWSNFSFSHRGDGGGDDVAASPYLRRAIERKS